MAYLNLILKIIHKTSNKLDEQNIFCYYFPCILKRNNLSLGNND